MAGGVELARLGGKAAMTCVLFVDDEPQVLEDIRLILRVAEPFRARVQK
jgi:hypothetical protein